MNCLCIGKRFEIFTHESNHNTVSDKAALSSRYFRQKAAIESKSKRKKKKKGEEEEEEEGLVEGGKDENQDVYLSGSDVEMDFAG